jgi:hypothetical protein
MNPLPEDLEFRVRRTVYETALTRGRLPLLAEVSEHLRTPLADVIDAARRLAGAHVLVLQPEGGEILMASPFSAVPTPFLVELPAYSCFGNCIWDALGIAAMTGRDARVLTECADCGTAMEVTVANGALVHAEGLAHFAVPARHWWDDIVFN